MSVGNPKKFKNLSKLDNAIRQANNATQDDIARVYKDKNYEVKKALKFKSGTNKSKLA